MLKNVSKILSPFLLIALLLLACTDEPSEKDSGPPPGGIAYSYPEPDAPKQAGKAFLGWYKSGSFSDITQRVDFTKKLSESFTMYPKWVDATGYTIGNDGVLARVPIGVIMEIPYNVNNITVKKIWSGVPNQTITGGGINPEVTQVYLPGKDLGEIGKRAFAYSSKLTSINIPQSVTVIGDNAFIGAHSLTSVTLPKKLASIGNAVFSDVTALTSITIPSTVTNIGATAFAGSLSLSSVRVKALTPPGMVTIAGIGTYTQFSNTHDDLIITVPPGGLADYQAAKGWKEYKDKIREVGQLEVMFNYNYVITPETTPETTPRTERRLVASGGTVSEPSAPVRTDFVFSGWYTNTAGTGSAWNFATALTADTTLYAKWNAKES